MVIDYKFGKAGQSAMKLARLERGLTLQQLADAAEMSLSAVHKAENGVWGLKLFNALKLASVLQKRVEELWGLKDESEEDEERHRQGQLDWSSIRPRPQQWAPKVQQQK